MTSLKTIFAVIPSAGSVECALAAFAAVADAGSSKLIGVHVSPLAVSYGLGPDIALADFVTAQMEAAEKERESAEAAFSDACKKAGIAYEWRTEKSPSDRLSPHAGFMSRSADLIIYPILPQDEAIGRHRIEEVVFAAGRPVLAFPSAWSRRGVGKRIVVAWNGGREATRAVFDALPLVLKAHSVRIVSIQGTAREPTRQFTPGDDIAATLSRHGVRAETTALHGSGGSVADLLQAQMLETDGDLLVMGCYGHSRFREMVLGGVSRELLSKVQYPMLLSN